MSSPTGHKSQPAGGRAWILGDDVDTDAIIAATHLATIDPGRLAAHCLQQVLPEFAAQARAGDVIVAGSNFGCGSSREHAPLAIKAAGVTAVIARSFARIFYRNSINLGLAVLECPDAVVGINDGDRIEVDSRTGVITNLGTGVRYQSQQLPDSVQAILDAGGLIAHGRRRLQEQGESR